MGKQSMFFDNIICPHRKEDRKTVGNSSKMENFTHGVDCRKFLSWSGLSHSCASEALKHPHVRRYMRALGVIVCLFAWLFLRGCVEGREGALYQRRWSLPR